MTTVTESRIVGGITDNRINITASQTTPSDGAANPAATTTTTTTTEEEAPALPPKESHAAKAMQMLNAEPPPDPASLSGILKGGKLWKSEGVSRNAGCAFITIAYSK